MSISSKLSRYRVLRHLYLLLTGAKYAEVLKRLSGFRHLGKLEHDVAAVAHDPGADHKIEMESRRVIVRLGSRGDIGLGLLWCLLFRVQQMKSGRSPSGRCQCGATSRRRKDAPPGEVGPRVGSGELM